MPQPPQRALRFHYQSNTSFDSLPRYAAGLRAHVRTVLGDTADVAFHGLPDSLYGNALPGQVLRYPYLKHLVQDAALEACLQAARSGIDAFIVGSFSEPLLKASRSAVDIPVLSLPEGPRSGDGSARGGGGGVRGAARRAIDAGADLLIPAVGLLNEVIHAHKLCRVGGAAVMDCVGVVLLHAEMMVRARRVLNLGVGREWSYPIADEEQAAQVRRGSGRAG